ncbi:IS21 family transposase [Gemmata sp. G18]|uniref:IS21 family transposase n=1 Tax=Gemmata palustris TaxID=2822762 RepID=A0ABS5BQ96_9BACT|nr:IS21 family transposase [Gemmata palustris]MBP3955617.1 IS21 family transposase [Gemmata palustris]
MLTVDDYAQIREARRDGLTIRELAVRFGRSPKTVLKALADPQPRPYTRTAVRSAPVFDPFRAIVDDILVADRTAPPKQRHTATQIFRRLVAEHGYTGSYHPIQRHLKQHRLDRRETFIPLAHPPGRRAEADFGHIHADFPDGRRLVPVLVVTWSYSNCPFALALPTERTEAVLQGLVEAFAFFGCVPRELWWDNPRTVALRIHKGRERTPHPQYAALASHYTFAPRFCMPATPTEKPRVEKRVQDLERQWATPVPRVGALGELNAHLLRQCLAARERTCGDNTSSVATRFEHDRAAALAAPARAFDPCVIQPGQADKYQTVPFDRNRYSVPRRWAFRTVSVKGYVDRVEVVGDGATVAAHARCYRTGQKVLDPLHFLGTLEKKPAALDHAPVYRDWQLPAAFAALRAALVARLGSCIGNRHYIRVLQLLANHTVDHMEGVLAGCLSRGELDAATITGAARRGTLDAPSISDRASSLALATVTVRPTDLAQFDRLLSRSSCEGDADVRRDDPAVAQGQLEATEAADDARRVGEAGP